MAAPSANSTMAVDRLCMMFPTIERPTIQNILVNECHSDTTKAIVILSRIHQFNTSMHNSGQTSNSGEANITVLQSQQIPLSINSNPPIQPIQSSPQNISPANNDCCNCANCCQCCLIKPASYRNGLYRIDYRMYNISYLLFSAFTIYPESMLYALSQSYQGLYLPTIGLSLLFIASLFMFFKRDNKISDSINCIRGSLFIFGGLLYFLGYIIHSVNITDICDNYNWDYSYDYWDCAEYSMNDITPEPEYLIGRGIFVGFHAIFIGLLYVSNNSFIKCFHSRLKLIRIWSFLFLIFSLLVLCWIMYPWYFLSYMAFAPVIIQIILLLNCCLIKKSNESGGCNSGVTLGLIIVIAYYFSLLWLVIFIIIKSWIHEEEQSWYLFWDLSILLFGAMQLWILGRAMSPANANCGCNMDGNGDGNLVNTQGQGQQQQQQVVMVIQPPVQQQQQVGMMPIVTAATLTNKHPIVIDSSLKGNMDVDDDDEGDNQDQSD